jgi:hypothetical protein
LDGSPAGRTNRGSAVSCVEANTGCGHGVQPGGLDGGVAVTAQVKSSQVIGNNEDDVGLVHDEGRFAGLPSTIDQEKRQDPNQEKEDYFFYMHANIVFSSLTVYDEFVDARAHNPAGLARPQVQCFVY